MQGAQILRSEAYVWYVATTKDAAQHRRWTFYEAVKLELQKRSQTVSLLRKVSTLIGSNAYPLLKIFPISPESSFMVKGF